MDTITSLGSRAIRIFGPLVILGWILCACGPMPGEGSGLSFGRRNDNLFKPAIREASSQLGRASTRLPLRVGVREFEKPPIADVNMPQGLEVYGALSEALTAALDGCGGFESAEIIRRGNERAVDLVIEPRLSRGACWRETEGFRKQYFKIEFDYSVRLSSGEGTSIVELSGVPLERAETRRYEDPLSQFPYLHQEVGSLIADSFHRFALSVCEHPRVKEMRPHRAPAPDPPVRRSKLDNTRSPVPVEPP